MIRRPPRSTLFPTRRSSDLHHWLGGTGAILSSPRLEAVELTSEPTHKVQDGPGPRHGQASPDRKSTRLNSSHANISYAVFCLKKKNNDYRLKKSQETNR